MKSVIAVLGIVSLWSWGAIGQNLPTGTPNEVFQSICGDGGAQTPREWDGTGYGLSIDQIGKYFHKGNGIQAFLPLNQQQYNRFSRIFDEAEQDYRAFIQTLPADRRDYYAATIARNRKPTIQQLNLNVMDYGKQANASYSPPTNSFSFTIALLKNPYVSDYEVYLVILHEMGHSTDPNLVGHSINDDDHVVPACFENVFLNKPTAEDYADWMAAQVFENKVAGMPDAAMKKVIVSNGLRLWCVSPKAKTPPLEKLLSLLGVHDPHSAPFLRFLYMARQPGLLHAVGYSSISLQGKTMPSCSLQHDQGNDL